MLQRDDDSQLDVPPTKDTSKSIDMNTVMSKVSKRIYINM